MDRNELFDKLKYLSKYAGELWGGQTKITREDAEIIRAVHWELLPGQRLNMGCPECIKHALVVCISYYEREAHKFQSEPLIENIEVVDEVEEEKPKKKKTKSS